MRKLKGFESVNVLGYEVFSSSLDIINVKDITKDTILINTFSPNSYGLALNDKLLEDSLKNSDILVLDGVGIALGSILINGKNIKKIAGQDCFDYLMAQANQHHLKVFFMGSTDATLEKIKKKAGREYPNVSIETYSPPFKDTFTESENKEIHNAINQFSPDILFLGMSAPKQEKWAYVNKDKVDVKIISTIGNVFDWYAENSKRPAKIWIDLRLEWLVRIFLRPEIFRRNTKNQLKFLRDVFLHLLHIKRIK
jgi:N-acetylglucosaminyldiphosphoundecaprenol N-acetyl-beta-D-mannosaminyltransferase